MTVNYLTLKKMCPQEGKGNEQTIHKYTYTPKSYVCIHTKARKNNVLHKHKNTCNIDNN